ncbi:MAG: Uma2 family endonuclease [Myxococcota bacterium]
MTTSATAPSLTLAGWGALPEGQSGELVDGRLEEEEVPTRLHEAAVAWLLFELTAWARRHGARVYGSDLKLRVAHDRGRKPDVSVYLAGTPRSGARETVQTLPPDVVVEVVSPGPADARRDRIIKPGEYAAAGIPNYWLLDPELRSFVVWVRGDDGRYVRALSVTDGVAHPALLPGLALDALWADLDAELDPPE